MEFHRATKLLRVETMASGETGTRSAVVEPSIFSTTVSLAARERCSAALGAPISLADEEAMNVMAAIQQKSSMATRFIKGEYTQSQKMNRFSRYYRSARDGSPSAWVCT